MARSVFYAKPAVHYNGDPTTEVLQTRFGGRSNEMPHEMPKPTREGFWALILAGVFYAIPTVALFYMCSGHGIRNIEGSLACLIGMLMGATFLAAFLLRAGIEFGRILGIMVAIPMMPCIFPIGILLGYIIIRDLTSLETRAYIRQSQMAPAGIQSGRSTSSLDPQKPKTCQAAAMNPVRVRASEEKLRRLQPELFGMGGYLRGALKENSDRLRVEEHLFFGESQPAVVMSAAPLIVAAYSEELDAVAMLQYPQEFSQEYRLQPGTRLLAATIYPPRGQAVAADLCPGPGWAHRYTNFHPVVADFLSDEMAAMHQKKLQIAEPLWQKTWQLGCATISRPGWRLRDGRPLQSGEPIEPTA